MKMSIGLGLAAAMAMTVIARGEPQRTLRVREDQRPAARQLELSLSGEMSQRDSAFKSSEKLDQFQTALELRYGLAKDFTLNAAVPFVSTQTDFNGRQNGLGDVRVGFEVVTWRDVFDYPWIMPYAEVVAPTGDDKKGLGTGDVSGSVGVAMGSTAIRYTHFVLDIRYNFVQNGDNVFSGGLAMIHEFSKQFSVSIEAILREKSGGEKSTPKTFIGGMTYKPAPAWAVSVFAGDTSGGDGGTIAGARATYSFK